MRPRVVAVLAFALLIAAFAADVLTPQTLVVAILLDIPIVLAALTRSRRLTAWLVGSALAADLVAAFANAARDNYHWDPIGIGDRVFSMLSIVMVGYLSTAVQERAMRLGELAAQDTRARREATLSSAADRIRSSLSTPVVARAVVGEAPRVLEAIAAHWYPANGAELLAQREGATEVEVIDAAMPPEIGSLVHRVTEDGSTAIVRGVDPLGRFVLGRLGAKSALAIPLVDRGYAYGVLVASYGVEVPDDALVVTARGYAAVCVNALAQARLFDELAERNEALSERQAVIRDLVYAISHDLRTPLAALSMTLRQASDGAFGALPARYADVVRESLVSIDDLQRLAETLLLVARFESGERKAEREPVDLAALAREIVAELGAMAQARKIALVLEAAEPAVARGSRGDLRRAIANLVANAVQHTPEGGTVELRVAPSGANVQVTVADDGYGVPSEIRRSLFQRFTTGSGAGAGTGLGLYIVRRIAEESGGGVRYEPRAPRGSVFSLALPKAAR